MTQSMRQVNSPVDYFGLIWSGLILGSQTAKVSADASTRPCERKKSAESWTKKLHLIWEGLRIIHFHKDLLEQYAFSLRSHQSKVGEENCFSFFQSLSVPDHPCISGRSSMHYLIDFCPLSSPERKVDMRISKAPRCIPKMFSLPIVWVSTKSLKLMPSFPLIKTADRLQLAKLKQSHRLSSKTKCRELTVETRPRQRYT